MSPLYYVPVLSWWANKALELVSHSGHQQISHTGGKWHLADVIGIFVNLIAFEFDWPQKAWDLQAPGLQYSSVQYHQAPAPWPEMFPTSHFSSCPNNIQVFQTQTIQAFHNWMKGLLKRFQGQQQHFSRIHFSYSKCFTIERFSSTFFLLTERRKRCDAAYICVSRDLLWKSIGS